MSDTKTASNYIDGSILRTEIKNYKHLLKSKIPQNRYFAETARYRAESVLERFVDGDLQLEPKDYDTMEKYIIAFCKIRRKTVNKLGYNAFERLNLISQEQRYINPNAPYISRLFKKINLSIKYRLDSWSDSIYNLKHVFSPLKPAENWLKKNKKYLLIGTAGLVVGLGSFLGFQKKSSAAQEPKIPAPAVQTSKHADTVVQPQNETSTLKLHADSIWKNYYDTALQIHLGQDGRDKLYRQVEKMIKTSSLSLEDGASIESYAHALTMYRLIQPNGSANAFLQKALQQNQSLSPSEQNKLAHLLAQAGKKGEKLKGTSSYSNFNKQHKNLKDKHIKNLKQLHRLKKQLGR